MEKDSTAKTNNSFYRISIFIIATYFLFTGLYYIQGILVPILFGALLAMLVLPMCNWLEKKGINRGISIFICVLLIIVIVSGIIVLFSSQIAELTSDFPTIKEKATEKFQQVQVYIEDKTDIPASKQAVWLSTNYQKLISGAGDYLGSIVVGVSTGLGNFLLTLIYVFFFLLLRERLKNFILLLFHKKDHELVNVIVEKTKNLTIRYITGLLIEIVIYGVLCSIGFVIIGIKQPIFFGFLAGVLNLIPYLGAIIGAALPMFAAFIYEDSFLPPLGVLIVSFIVQFNDNNFVTPKIVAGYIRINALATVVVIIIGGALWGISGMVLFLPLLGILKIIFDNIEPLQPFGYLIGEDKKEGKAGFGTKYKEWREKRKEGNKAKAKAS